MISVSAVIISFNEAANIERCIRSLVGVVDEILVLDSGSTDGTIELATNLGAIVHHHPFDDYAAQKNRANALAANDVIWSLDADEVISDQLKASILAVKANWSKTGYRVNRLTMFCGKFMKHGGWYPDDNIRLFDRTKGRWTGAKVHESFRLDNGDSGATLKGDLLHYSYDSVTQYANTITKYSRLKGEVLAEKNKPFSILALVFSPIWKFVATYFFKLGLLDGLRGFIVAVGAGYGVFIKYAVLWQLRQAAKRG